MKYSSMIGVGGIGSGSFFALSGNTTLGREESRGGRFLDRRDYCKLHIISHYVKSLLGESFEVTPVGRVGDDDAGSQLLREMDEAALDLRYVEKATGEQTLFSFCYIYPDGSGGNFTTDDSACSKVDASYVRSAEPEFNRFAGRGIALAVPEVPVEARVQLLDLATEYDFFRVASFTSEEMGEALSRGLLRKVDLLAVNADEASVAAELDANSAKAEQIAAAAVEELMAVNSDMLIIITAGASGSWSWDGNCLRHVPRFDVEAVSTAGAGDAHLSGIIAGVVQGLPLDKAQELGTLTAAMSVTSAHTIDKRINPKSLAGFVRDIGATLSADVRRVLEE